VCFANTATNAAVLDHLARHTPLVYTPHDQPLWTIPTNAQQAATIADVHARMVQRSDATLCDSTIERRQIQTLAPTRNNALFLPLGCDFSHFQPGPSSARREQLLFVGDLVEPRKRFDRALDLLARLRADRPRLTLLVIGNRGEEFRDRIPPALQEAVQIRGYVEESELKRAYAESAGLVLLSDYEAFGMPILEALASRTPVFLNEIPACWSLFGIYRGATFCPGGDPEATAARVASALDLGPHLIDAMKQDEYHLRQTFGWKQLARRKWELVAAAWHRRAGFALSA
jgi:glycosyltransferase involved in cell wall biosynthesis